MAHQISLSKEKFEEAEKNILKQVIATTKSLIEIFKFRMIYGTKVSSKQNKEALRDLKKFRVKNWDPALNRKEAYKKYFESY